MSLLDRYKPVGPAPKVSPLARLGNGSVAIDPAHVISDQSTRPWAGAAVRTSRDLTRVLELPIKPDLAPAALIEHYTARLRRQVNACLCRSKFGKPCVTRLNAVQAQALHEMHDPDARIGKASGLFAPIKVGGGKTLVGLLGARVIPGCKRAMLLIPSSLRSQLLLTDWEFYSQHWELPNLAGARFMFEGLPFLHVVSYNELSATKSTDLFEKLQPDTVICDEAHTLRNLGSVRTDRFQRYARSHPGTRFVFMSGTLTSKSLKSWSHLAGLALGEGSPAPTDPQTAEEWATAVDVSDLPAPMGALRALCKPGENVRDAYRRRLFATKGVVGSVASGEDCNASLVISKRDPPPMPAVVVAAMRKVDATWTRPDGEEMTDALSHAACMNQIACGLFYRWIYPRGEPAALIDEWFEARQNWNRELREKLKRSRVHLDSPKLCTQAAIRHLEGYDGPLPVWDSEHFPEWHRLHRLVKHQQDTVWIDKWLVRDAAKWAADKKEGPGVVWYNVSGFGAAVAHEGGLPWYGAGKAAAEAILKERGDRSVVASIVAHGTGRNLQHAFHRGLVVNVPPSGQVWEQLIGRFHRPGQEADCVTFDVYAHTAGLVAAWERAKADEDLAYPDQAKLKLATFTGGL